MKQRTVRELGGEIWAEISNDLDLNFNERRFKIDDISIQTLDSIIDLVSGVLARYEGFMIVNDEDLPVEPLPKIEFPE